MLIHANFFLVVVIFFFNIAILLVLLLIIVFILFVFIFVLVLALVLSAHVQLGIDELLELLLGDLESVRVLFVLFVQVGHEQFALLLVQFVNIELQLVVIIPFSFVFHGFTIFLVFVTIIWVPGLILFIFSVDLVLLFELLLLLKILLGLLVLGVFVLVLALLV